MLCICHNIWMNKLFGLLLFSGVALLNWFTKGSRFEGLNDNELLWSFPKSVQWVLLLSVFVQQVRKFLLKGKILLQHSMQYQDFADFKIPVVQIIKIVLFNMNPKFTEVTLNIFIFVRVIFYTNPATKFGLSDNTHEVRSSLQDSLILWVKSHK